MTARAVSAKAWFVQVVLVFFVAVLPAPAADAASTFTVNTTADEHDFNAADPFCDADPGPAELCTLRAAIEQTNQQPGPDTVIVPDGTYTLGLGQLMISDDLLLDGSQAATTIIRPELVGACCRSRPAAPSCAT